MKRKLFAILLTVSLVFTAVACSPAKETVTDVEFDWDSAEAISFEELLKETSEAHRQESLNTEAFRDFENSMAEGEEYQNLLTEAELKILQESWPLNGEHILAEDFKEDVDLLFRFLKSFYGPYFYFGGEKAFDKVQKNIDKLIMDFDPDVPGNELIRVFNKYLSFLQDRGVEVRETPVIDTNQSAYSYYYCSLYFSKDETGYYTMASGEKWYYESCRNEDVTIRPVLTPEGEIKYSPVLWSLPKRARLDDKVNLVSGEKQAHAEFDWTQGQADALKSGGNDFTFTEAEGTSYICIGYLGSDSPQNLFTQFEETARRAQDSRLIVYDLRGCRGNAEDAARNWAANFTGDDSQLNSVMAVRRNGACEVMRTEGTFSNNDIPIIILVDSCTSEFGELALLYAKTIENAIVIGSNTSGSQLSSDQQKICLPNSGVDLTIPASIKFYNNMDNTDGIGYAPDIWCNPETVMAALSNLLEKEGYAKPETVNKPESVNQQSSANQQGSSNQQEADSVQQGPILKDDPVRFKQVLDEVMENRPDAKMLIVYDKFIVGENDSFGGENFDDDLIFLYEGERISGFTIIFEHPDIAQVTYNEDGSVHIKLPTQGNWPFRVEYKGESYQFILAV